MKKFLLFIGLVVLISLIQIVNIVEGAQYQWKSAVIIFLALLLLTSIFFGISKIRLKKNFIEFKNENYDFVINSKKTFIDRIRAIHYLYYIKALAYLEKGDLENFKIYIDKITLKELLLTKLYLLFIFYTLINDSDQLARIKDLYLLCPSKKNALKKDGKIKDYYNQVIALIEKREALTEEEEVFVKAIPFKSIKDLVYKNKSEDIV